jgi:protein-disulfide isomerase
VDKKAWIIFSVIVVALLGGLVYLSAKDRIDVSGIDGTKVLAATEKSGNIGDRLYGNKDSKVVLVEYGDFQCPGCGGAHPQIKAISEEYKDKIAFVFRNFPLTNIHPNARAAAAAVEAAGFQGKYWEMHNMVFENQDNWKDASTSERDGLFTGYAEAIGINKERFVADLSNANISKKISYDQALGKKVNVSGTPTFFLNGKELEESVTNNIIQADGAELKKLLDEALK